MLFIIDFDGTLAVADTVDTLLERYAEPAWRLAEQEWLDGRITAMQCMRRQLRLVRADHVALENFFRGIRLDASFLPFYRHVSRYAAVAVVSDGLDHAIGAAMRGADMPVIPVYANRLHYVADGLDISFPHAAAECRSGAGVCKCAVARTLARDCGGPVVLVGDGKSDACLAARADVVFAKGSLIDHCERDGIPYLRFQTFADVLATARTWPRGVPPQAVPA